MNNKAIVKATVKQHVTAIELEGTTSRAKEAKGKEEGEQRIRRKTEPVMQKESAQSRQQSTMQTMGFDGSTEKKESVFGKNRAFETYPYSINILPQATRASKHALHTPTASAADSRFKLQCQLPNKCEPLKASLCAHIICQTFLETCAQLAPDALCMRA